MNFFSKQVDKRSTNAMVQFLENHFRYSTMNSWNNTGSYAHCVKLHKLGLSSAQQNAAYEVLGADQNYWDKLEFVIEEFTRSMNGYYTIGSNGRSGGYLVLYRSHYESTGYLSYCTKCGQRNYKKVAAMPNEGTPDHVIATELLKSSFSWRDDVYLTQEAIKALDLSDVDKLALVRKYRGELKDATLGCKCGCCGQDSRKNYEKSPTRLVTENRGVDQDCDFADLTMYELRQKVEVVQAFDRACDQIRETFISLCEDYEVVEETVMVPKTVRVLQPRA